MMGRPGPGSEAAQQNGGVNPGTGLPWGQHPGMTPEQQNQRLMADQARYEAMNGGQDKQYAGGSPGFDMTGGANRFGGPNNGRFDLNMNPVAGGQAAPGTQMQMPGMGGGQGYGQAPQMQDQRGYMTNAAMPGMQQQMNQQYGGFQPTRNAMGQPSNFDFNQMSQRPADYSSYLQSVADKGKIAPTVRTAQSFGTTPVVKQKKKGK